LEPSDIQRAFPSGLAPVFEKELTVQREPDMKSQEKVSARPSLKVKGVDVLGYGTSRYSTNLI